MSLFNIGSCGRSKHAVVRRRSSGRERVSRLPHHKTPRLFPPRSRRCRRGEGTNGEDSGRSIEGRSNSRAAAAAAAAAGRTTSFSCTRRCCRRSRAAPQRQEGIASCRQVEGDPAARRLAHGRAQDLEGARKLSNGSISECDIRMSHSLNRFRSLSSLPHLLPLPWAGLPSLPRLASRASAPTPPCGGKRL